MSTQESSEVKGAAQESGAEQQPSQTPPSAAKPAAQEQPRPEETTKKPEELSPDETIRRRVQSEIDRRIHAERQRWEREQSERQQQQRVMSMSDEELGAYMKENTRFQEATQGAMREALAQTFTSLQEQALNAITDTKARAALQERTEKGEFKTFQEFLAAVHEAEVGHREAKIQTRLEKQIREAVQKELAAQETEDGGPDLGAGVSVTPKKYDITKDSADKLIAEGITESLSRKKKGGK